MSCSESSRAVLLLVALMACGSASAEHVLGVGGQFDSEDSRAVSAFGSWSVGEERWLSLLASRATSDGQFADLDTVYFDAGYDHYFDPLGLRIAAAYWGDPDLLDSTDVRASLYWRGDRGSVSLDLERRAFDLTLRRPLTGATRTIGFDADGVGASLRVDATDAISLYANGMHYDYSRDIALQPDIAPLRVFALSSLSSANSLLEQRLSAGIEVRAGERTIDLRLASYETAVFGDRIDSVGIGLLTPLGAASDIELRLAVDESDATGRATLISVFLYFYGE